MSDDQEDPKMDERKMTGPAADLPSDIVYVRELRAEETAALPQTPPNAKIFAIHAADGERLALTDDRGLAFRLAREHDRTPVSVH
ncbi:MAG: DUF1150 family protein [Pseudomonadota bacterium]